MEVNVLAQSWQVYGMAGGWTTYEGTSSLYEWCKCRCWWMMATAANLEFFADDGDCWRMVATVGG